MLGHGINSLFLACLRAKPHLAFLCRKNIHHTESKYFMLCVHYEFLTTENPIYGYLGQSCFGQWLPVNYITIKSGSINPFACMANKLVVPNKTYKCQWLPAYKVWKGQIRCFRRSKSRPNGLLQCNLPNLTLDNATSQILPWTMGKMVKIMRLTFRIYLPEWIGIFRFILHWNIFAMV